jgi:hypothetical protein
MRRLRQQLIGGKIDLVPAKPLEERVGERQIAAEGELRAAI